MLCKIADLITEIPDAGDLVPRCRDYLYDGAIGADIIIRTDLFNMTPRPGLTEDDIIYLQSGFRFNGNLLKFHGMMLHASAVELDGKAYLFSAPCGTGKSTHTRLWQTLFGEKARVFNDDKPALRCIDGVWYAFGTPWCGKDAININMKVPVAGICFLKQAKENKIRRLTQREAMQKVISQTIYKFKEAEMLDLMLNHVASLVQSVPIFELENRPEVAAVHMSYETMHHAAEEMNL